MIVTCILYDDQDSNGANDEGGQAAGDQEDDPPANPEHCVRCCCSAPPDLRSSRVLARVPPHLTSAVNTATVSAPPTAHL